MNVFHLHWGLRVRKIIPFKVAYTNWVRSSKKKWPANGVFSGYRNHRSKHKIYRKDLQVLHKFLMKMKYPTNLKAWILHLQIFHQDSRTMKIFIFPSVIIPNTQNCSLTAKLVFFMRFKDAQIYPFQKKNKWKSKNGLHTHWKMLGHILAKERQSHESLAHKLQLNCSLFLIYFFHNCVD